MAKLTPTPLYEQVRTSLVRRIARGEWAPGSMIPTDHELAQEYCLSPGTVRKALDCIADLQLIVRKQGRGTFVLDWTSHEVMLPRLRFLSARTRLPVLGTIARSTLTTGKANQEEMQNLRVKEEDVFRIEQLRNLDGTSLSWERHVVPASLFPDLPTKPHEILVFSEFAFRHGVLVGPGRERVSYAKADDDVARELGVTRGGPLFRIERLLNTIDGVPAGWRVGWYNPEQIIYEAELK